MAFLSSIQISGQVDLGTNPETNLAQIQSRFERNKKSFSTRNTHRPPRDTKQARMDQLIPIVNKLQDVFNAIGESSIHMPQIVVIGSQSSGKSSVLEKIVGRDFLPRGTGIVTRRPLILQLYNISTIHTPNEPKDDKTNDKGEEWGEFLHREGVKFHDFNDIRREIEKETERLTGKNKGISNKSINLKIYSPHVLNLTLVDLPGITKVPVGDQPTNIEDQIREMCLRFISNPNSIILAVTAANTDLANSDALKMARDIDKEGVRTIGVLTKLDLMDEGTDALEMLQGRVIPLKRGFVGVVNRSQKDILDQLPIRESNAKERVFFKSHKVYGQMTSKLGTEYLSRSLNMILMHHIRDCLPEIKSRINTMVVEVDQQCQEMGKSTTEMSTTELGATLLQLLSNFAQHFIDSLEGRASSNLKHHQASDSSSSSSRCQQLYGGARIHYIFNDVFSVTVEAVDPFDDLSDDDIFTNIRNANGLRQSLFVPEVSFELLAKRQIARLQAPGLQCVELVFDEMQRVMSQCEISMDLSRFGGLRDRVVEVVNNMLRASLGPTQQMINNLIQIELAFINTSHPDFIGGSRSLHLLMKKYQPLDRSIGHSSSTSTSNSLGSQPTSYGAKGVTSHVSSGPGAPVAAAASVDFNNNVQSSSSSSSAGDPQQYGRMTSFLFNNKSQSDQSNSKKQISSTSLKNDHQPSVVQLPQVPMTIMQQGADYRPSEKEEVEKDLVKSLLDSYFNIVRKNYLDLVPKTIMRFMVNHAKENLQNELVSNLYKEGMLAELLRETSDVSAQRATCHDLRGYLQQALDIVNEVRDFNTFH